MIQTEQAQYALANIMNSIRDARTCLLDRRKVLQSKVEQEEGSEESANAIAVIDLRLDTLYKVESRLLTPLWDEYQSIEQPIEHHEPGKLSAMAEKRRTGFVESMLQGL